jgi:hypothetical protein
LNITASCVRPGGGAVTGVLGFSAQEIPILMAEGILKPLGRPARNGPKYFAAAELEDLRRNLKWLAKASDAIVGYWQKRNADKKSICVKSERMFSNIKES